MINKTVGSFKNFTLKQIRFLGFILLYNKSAKGKTFDNFNLKERFL